MCIITRESSGLTSIGEPIYFSFIKSEIYYKRMCVYHKKIKLTGEFPKKKTAVRTQRLRNKRTIIIIFDIPGCRNLIESRIRTIFRFERVRKTYI